MCKLDEEIRGALKLYFGTIADLVLLWKVRLCYYSDVVINKPLAVAATNITISISIIIDATI
jgi:hypothetical protein